MRTLLLLSFLFTCAFTACEVGPGCRLIPAGCNNADKICCTSGWDETCSCCPDTTTSIPTTERSSTIRDTTVTPTTLEPTIPVTTPQVTETPTKSSTTSESTSISVTTGFGSTVTVSSTGVTVTVTTPQSVTTLTTPSAIIEQALNLLVPIIVGIVLLVLCSVALFMYLNTNMRNRAISFIQRCLGRDSGPTPTSSDLIDLEPLPFALRTAERQTYDSVNPVGLWNTEGSAIPSAPSDQVDWNADWPERWSLGSDVVYERQVATEGV